MSLALVSSPSDIVRILKNIPLTAGAKNGESNITVNKSNIGRNKPRAGPLSA